jgi:menaquinone-dependent protoporphyrinogen oxidase
VLLIYSTTDGHTRTICDRLGTLVRSKGKTVEIREIAAVSESDLAAAESVVIGASIRYGKHSPAVVAMLKGQRALLQQRKFAFFSVNVVARKKGKDSPTTNPYLLKFLKKIGWKPAVLEVFAGRIDYPSYGSFDRFMIRLIMLMTGGPTDPKGVYEFTDWRRVDAFADTIANL